MALKPDRRPERTRSALLVAFNGLLLERGFEAVTVDDVVARANIGRSTLYAHFGGLEGMLKESLKGASERLVELIDPSAAPGDLAPLLSHFKDQRRRNAVFLAPPLRGLWVRSLADLIGGRLVDRARTQGRPTPALPWAFIATQVAEGQISLLANWLTTRSTLAPDIIAAALIATTHATMDSLAQCEPTP